MYVFYENTDSRLNISCTANSIKSRWIVENEYDPFL